MNWCCTKRPQTTFAVNSPRSSVVPAECSNTINQCFESDGSHPKCEKIGSIICLSDPTSFISLLQLLLLPWCYLFQLCTNLPPIPTLWDSSYILTENHSRQSNMNLPAITWQGMLSTTGSLSSWKQLSLAPQLPLPLMAIISTPFQGTLRRRSWSTSKAKDSISMWLLSSVVQESPLTPSLPLIGTTTSEAHYLRLLRERMSRSFVNGWKPMVILLTTPIC